MNRIRIGSAILTAIIGGSGTVTFEGHNIHAEYASPRSRIGLVPQGDVMHHQLTVHQARGYAAALRLRR